MPQPLTPAELRVALDSLGFQNERMAELLGVRSSVLYEYVRPSRISPIPEHRAAIVRGLLADFEAAADRIARGTEGPEAEVIRLYSAASDFWRAVPELKGWPLKSQQLVVAEAQRRTDYAIPVVFS